MSVQKKILEVEVKQIVSTKRYHKIVFERGELEVGVLGTLYIPLSASMPRGKEPAALIITVEGVYPE